MKKIFLIVSLCSLAGAASAQAPVAAPAAAPAPVPAKTHKWMAWKGRKVHKRVKKAHKPAVVPAAPAPAAVPTTK
jgi:hypothetical protein